MDAEKKKRIEVAKTALSSYMTTGDENFKAAVQNLIDSTDLTDLQRFILTKRFVELWNWRRICDVDDRDKRWLQRSQNRGLLKIYKRMQL